MADGLTIRPARREDVPHIAALFADDTLGHGDTADPAAAGDYLRAYAAIEASPADMLYVAEAAGKVVGTFQTTLTTSMTGRGARTMTIATVQTRADMRGQGIGAAMVRFAIARAREAGARQVQLMSNAVRHDAHRFYERLGFAKSHVGFKMKLD